MAVIESRVDDFDQTPNASNVQIAIAYTDSDNKPQSWSIEIDLSAHNTQSLVESSGTLQDNRAAYREHDDHGDENEAEAPHDPKQKQS